MPSQPKNPLHGVTLETIIRELVDFYGWEELGRRVAIRCFTHDPGIKSSLHFLRRTPWARDKVERLYLGWRGRGDRRASEQGCEENKEEILYRPNVAALLVDRNGRVFIAERTDVRDAWQFPQGGIDEGESPEEALGRELIEEIDLAPEKYTVRRQQGGYRYVFPGGRRKWRKFRGQEQTYFLCDFQGSDADINLATAHPEFRSFRWIDPATFSLRWVPDFKRRVYRDVLRDFFAVEPLD
jgi:putative (di)nucleoside polyphosphate hydrolase